MEIGRARSRIAFDKRMTIDDGAGNTEGDFAEQFVLYGNLVPKFGGETVMAGRLQGKSTFVLTIRYSSLSRRITTDWRARNVRTGETYNIRNIDDAEERHQWLELLVESGVAA